jgi:hypothetical protein
MIESNRGCDFEINNKIEVILIKALRLKSIIHEFVLKPIEDKGKRYHG